MPRAREISFYIALDAPRAAQALCMSEGEFRALVNDGVLPQPARLGTMERWDANRLLAILRGERAYSEDLE